MEYILDSVWGESLQNIGAFMNIAYLVTPTSVQPNTAFDITYNAVNAATVTLNAYGMIWDTAANQMVSGSYWEAQVPAGGTNPIVVNFPNGITQSFSGEVRVGHIEGTVTCYRCNPTTNVLESQDFTGSCPSGWQTTQPTCGGLGCSNPTGNINDLICGDPAYANAPVEGRKYQCTNSGWADQGVDATFCPLGLICNNPSGNAGDLICGDPAYANAPVKGRRYQCTNGGWIDQGIDPTNCPGARPTINPLMIGALFAAVAVVGIVFLVGRK